MKSNKLLIVAAAAFALGGVATAGTGDDTNSVVVRYGDLNLESAAGIKSLHKRIRNAAQSVCSQLNTRILGLRDDYKQCVDKAVADGIAAVGNANLKS
jgi:UrcA family protein